MINAEEIYNQIISIRGKEAQMYKLTEECGEYIAALNQFKDGRVTMSELLEEIVDVEVLVEQMRIIFDERIDEWHKIKERKLRRLRDMINEQN